MSIWYMAYGMPQTIEKYWKVIYNLVFRTRISMSASFFSGLQGGAVVPS